MNAVARFVWGFSTAKSFVGSKIRAASTTQKLAVAFALFLTPLIFVSAKLADEQQKNLDIAHIEREGAAYLRVVNDATTLLNTQVRAQHFNSDTDNISAGIRALRQAEARYGATLGTAEYSERALFALQVMLSNRRSRGTAAGAASAALSDLAYQIGDASHLMWDPERISHFAVDVVLERAPLLAQEARDLASAAVDAFEDRRLTESEEARLLRSIATLQSATDALNQTIDAMMEGSGDERLTAAISPAAYGALTNFAAYRSDLEAMIASGRFDATQVIAREAGAQFALADLSGRVSRQLDLMLKTRAERLGWEGASTLALAALLFMSVLCAVVALLRVGLVRPIESLSHSVRALADGCYEADIPALERGDEIGDMARALAVLRDAAQAKIAADAARAAAESANIAKSQFVAAMSHELRTPLNAIIGYTEILTEDADERGDKAASSDLHRIVMAARHLLAVINDILDLSKIEAGRMDVLAAPTNPASIALEAIATAQPLADKNRNALITTIAPIENAYVDAQKLRQCLLNLLSNACKFTREGQVSLTMAQQEHAGESSLVFEVRDTGIGITAQQINRLFQPFVQADAAVTREFGGTGLGLMITRRMAQLMGGEISVESTPGEGTCFTLWIPQFYKGFGATPEADVFARIGDADAPLVLVIDDESSARDLVLRALSPLGFAVQGARTAEAGMTLAREAKPALIILDINLPDRSGWSMITDLALQAETASIPIVVSSVEEDRRRSIELGAAEHLVKPSSREQLCAMVLRYARERPAAALVKAQPVEETRLSA